MCKTGSRPSSMLQSSQGCSIDRLTLQCKSVNTAPLWGVDVGRISVIVPKAAAQEVRCGASGGS